MIKSRAAAQRQRGRASEEGGREEEEEEEEAFWTFFFSPSRAFPRITASASSVGMESFLRLARLFDVLHLKLRDSSGSFHPSALKLSPHSRLSSPSQPSHFQQ